LYAGFLHLASRIAFLKYSNALEMGEERKVYKALVGKPNGKRPLGRPRRRWENGI
jgi:hypothetical protein